MLDVKIEKAHQKDIEDFWTLFASTIQSDFPGYTPEVIRFFLEKLYTRTSFMYWIVHSMKTIYLARLDTIPVGFAVIDEPYGGVSFCRWLGVKKSHQKKGIGSQLVKRWISDAEFAECHKVELAAQPTARGFYKKIGLAEEGKREKSYFGIDQYVFGKVIGIPKVEVMVKHM